MDMAELLAVGAANMAAAHLFILIAGALGLASILIGLLSARIGAPVLLVFLLLGMLAGRDGPGGIPFDNYYAAYLIGSIALAVILIEGGLKTSLAMLRSAFWPALLLATIGVAISAGIVGGLVWLIRDVSLAGALLFGAAVAPTDAAAVASLLRRARIDLPERLSSLLAVESGLNDPMSIFLVLLLIVIMVEPANIGFGRAAEMFAREMLGGAALGMAGGFATRTMLRRLPLEPAQAGVLVLAAGLGVFGLAQMLETSGFLATYIAAIVIGTAEHRAREDVEHFFEAASWLSEIALFLILGLLVVPHILVEFIPGAAIGTAALILLARPAAVVACLAPFGFSAREMTFASWVGLRGAVPIYLSIIPALADPVRDARLFGGVFILVIASLLVQGWTIPAVARLLGYRRIAE